MAGSVKTTPELEEGEPPAFDLAAVDRRVQYHRARRVARLQRARDVRLARLRFWFVVCGLLLVCLVIAVTIWDQVERLFGL
jgi:hypothetical protein